MATIKFNLRVHEEPDGTVWAEVEELPGCFASGHSFEELEDAVVEAIQMCLPSGIVLGDAVSFEKVSAERALVYA